MTQNVSILSVKEKQTTKGQTYWSYNTDVGYVNCFDAAIAKDANEQGIGKLCEVDIQQEGKFKNLSRFYRVIGDAKKQDNNGHYDAKLRRITDCILAAHEAYMQDKIEKEDVFGYAEGLYNSVKKIEQRENEDSNVQPE